MSTNWTPMLSRIRCWPATVCSKVSCPCDFPHNLTWQVEMSPVQSGIDNKPTI